MRSAFFAIVLALGLLVPPVARCAAVPDDPTTEQMLAAMVMMGFRGAALDAVAPEFQRLLREGRIGHLILFDRDVSDNSPRNIISPTQLGKLTRDLRAIAPGLMFIAVDQEGGQVRRLKPQKGFFDLPSAQVMGQGNALATRELAEKQGQELHDLGINMDLAPVVDVDSNPFNPAIGRLGRAFGSDPLNVARHALAFGLGLAKARVVPVLKHFPGQGCAKEDSHLSLPDITQCWNPDIDLLPYADIFRQGWPGAVMLGHIFHRGLDGAMPASISRNIVTGLLRQGLRWNGVIISDDMQMKAIQQAVDLRHTVAQAIESGVDILLFGNNLEWDAQLAEKVISALRSLVDDGTIGQERLRQSWDRIRTLYLAFQPS